jgi:hypothetical protein
MRVVLKARKEKVVFFLAVCKAIYTGLLNHPALFPALPVALPLLLSQIQAVESGQEAVRTRVLGAAATRNDLVNALASSLETLRSYVESLCAASPEQAGTLAAAAAMHLRAAGTRSKPILAAKLGAVSGLVILAANRGLLTKSKKARFYEWQYTLDGKTFLAAPTTAKARTSIAGLPPLTTVGFRVRVTDTVTVGEWTQVVSIVVQ